MNANINFVNLDLVSGEVCDDPSQVWRERAVSAAPDMAGIPHNYCQYSQTLRQDTEFRLINTISQPAEISFLSSGGAKYLLTVIKEPTSLLQQRMLPACLPCLSHRLCPIIGLETCRER